MNFDLITTIICILIYPFIIAIGYLVACVLDFITKNKRKKIGDDLRKSIEKSIEETTLLRSKEIPTEEHIEKYYKMYLKKVECDDEWTTKEPMTFDEFRKRALNDNLFGGYRFLISMSADAFVGFGSDMQMIRYNDYEGMVEGDKNA